MFEIKSKELTFGIVFLKMIQFITPSVSLKCKELEIIISNQL